MFTMDVPYVPVQDTPIVLAQAATTAIPATTVDYLLNTCMEGLITSTDWPTAMDLISPGTELVGELLNRSGENIRDEEVVAREAAVKLTLLVDTAHGKLVSQPSYKGVVYYQYQSEPGYAGKDKAVFLAEFAGKRYKIVYNFIVSIHMDERKPLCPPSQLIKLQNNPASSSSGFGAGYDLSSVSVTFGALAGGAVGQETGANPSTSLGAGITFNLANLTGGAVGQDVGTNITLDTAAAGNGWFIDATGGTTSQLTNPANNAGQVIGYPADNSEFLATSNPNEWVAKAGSAAAGKMDMLSVLLHEYGHALGIDHSTNPHDFMGTTLTVGVRRLPSAAELALMQQLIAEAKNGLAVPSTPDNTPFPGLPISLGGLAFAGLLRPNRYGSSNIDILTTPKFDVAANPAFTSLNTASAWQTQGSVDVVPSTSSGQASTGQTGTATLNEISSAQTRLSQVFMLGANDRYLSFTLAGTALDNPSGAPQDAFEVALLNANTGASVLGTDGMTRSDAFLNLQADGTQNAASCVTCINNADGSRTYRVDLSGVAKNSAVNLSFDLLGFGAANSHVTLRDVRVSGLPQLRDATASVAEDNLLTINPYAQADTPLAGGNGGFASNIVNGPAHGSIAVNADGTFNYTPDANYNGADSFSYNLSDPSTGSGQVLNSNTATMSLNITSVNDAPTGTSNTVTTLENKPYVRFPHPPSAAVCR